MNLNRFLKKSPNRRQCPSGDCFFDYAVISHDGMPLYRTFVPAGAEGGDSSLVQTVIEQKEQQTITMDEKENNNEEKENGL